MDVRSKGNMTTIIDYIIMHIEVIEEEGVRMAKRQQQKAHSEMNYYWKCVRMPGQKRVVNLIIKIISHIWNTPSRHCCKQMNSPSLSLYLLFRLFRCLSPCVSRCCYLCLIINSAGEYSSEQKKFKLNIWNIFDRHRWVTNFATA